MNWANFLSHIRTQVEADLYAQVWSMSAPGPKKTAPGQNLKQSCDIVMTLGLEQNLGVAGY